MSPTGATERAARFRAGAVIVTSDDVRTSSEVTVVGGRIASVSPVPGHTLTDEERSSVLAPAWINAHAHLELGALSGRVPPGERFVDWVGALLGARGALGADELKRGARASADALLSAGTAHVIDVDSLGVVRPALAPDVVARVHGFVELLDASPEASDARTEAALAAARGAVHTGLGLSPHGPHTAGDDLLAALGADAVLREAPRTVHWAESTEEVEWLRDGTGPFERLLGPSPRTTGLERLARHGLLDGTLLVHGNLPQPEELALLERARGVAVVHCPGCHSFFGRGPFPVERYRAVGVPVLLGTDSAASNDALDMGREVRLARETLGLSPAEAFDAATRGPAHWIPRPGVTGTLSPGSAADLARHAGHDGGADTALEALTAGRLARGVLEDVGAQS